MVEIWEPRYRDSVVLIATRKLSFPLDIKITKGKYHGEYHILEEDVEGARQEKMQTKAGGTIDVTCVPLSKLRSGYGV